jgi:transposase-like protein
MPLLNIVGTICLNSNFYVAFCFLAKEEEDDYVWAMEQLKELYTTGLVTGVMLMDRELALMKAIYQVFPKTQYLLYIWHIEKNVLICASKAFEKKEEVQAFMKAWTEVVSSGSEAIFEKRWQTLQDTFDSQAYKLVQYLKEMWLDLWKRLIVQAYTDQYLHLGNRVTSRVEGAHSTLKSYL